MNKTNEIFDKYPKFLKSNSPNPYISEFTVFIIVRTPNLKDFSNSILEIVNKIVIENKDIIKTIIVKKYLFVSDVFVLEFIKDTLLR